MCSATEGLPAPGVTATEIAPLSGALHVHRPGARAPYGNEAQLRGGIEQACVLEIRLKTHGQYDFRFQDALGHLLVIPWPPGEMGHLAKLIEARELGRSP